MWTLAFVHHEDRTTTHGYADTREAAMAALARWCAERLSKKGPASGAGLKVDGVRHLKAPVSPSPQYHSAAFGSNHEAARHSPKREPRPSV